MAHHQNEDVAELKSEVIPVADPEKKEMCVGYLYPGYGTRGQGCRFKRSWDLMVKWGI